MYPPHCQPALTQINVAAQPQVHFPAWYTPARKNRAQILGHLTMKYGYELAAMLVASVLALLGAAFAKDPQFEMHAWILFATPGQVRSC